MVSTSQPAPPDASPQHLDAPMAPTPAADDKSWCPASTGCNSIDSGITTASSPLSNNSPTVVSPPNRSSSVFHRHTCRYWRQYRVLVWKNFVIRWRTPSMLLAELVFPLLFIFILVGFRSQDTVQSEPPCYVQSQTMPSMGLLQYAQSVVCNFNYTCQPTDPDPLVLLPDRSPLFFFLSNLTELLSDSGIKESLVAGIRGELSIFNLGGLWDGQHRLLETYNAFLQVSSSWSSILSNGTTSQLDRVRQWSQLICGRSSEGNDLGLTASYIERSDIVNFTELLRHVKFANQSESNLTTLEDNSTTEVREPFVSIGRIRVKQLKLCPTIRYLITWPPAAKQIGRLRQFLFGQVAYYPQTPSSERVMHQVSTVYRLLDHIRDVFPLYFSVARPWLVSMLVKHSSDLRDKLLQCSQSSLFISDEIGRICLQLWHWLTPQPDVSTHDAPDNSSNSSLTLHWNQTLNDLDWYVGLLEEFFSCLPNTSDRFLPFKNLTEFNLFLEETQSDRLRSPVGVLFEGLQNVTTVDPQITSIILRHNPMLVDTTYRYKVLDRYRSPIPRRHPDSDMKYFSSGFIDIQEMVSRAIISLNVPSFNKSKFGVQMKLFPFPAYLNDRLFPLFTFSLPQLMVLSWSLTVVSAVKHMVDEKEHGLLRVLVTTLGVPHLLVWAAWFTVPLILACTTSIILILILRFGGIFTLADPSLLFAYQLSYIVSILAYAAACSSLFTRANLAAVVAGCCYFICFVPAPLLQRFESYLPNRVILGCSFLPQVSHTFGWVHLIRMESELSTKTGQPVGAQWTNFWHAGRGAHFSMGTAFSLLWTATLLLSVTAIWVIPWTLEVCLWFNAYFSELFLGRVGPVNSKHCSTRNTGATAVGSTELLMDSMVAAVGNAKSNSDEHRLIGSSVCCQPSIVVDGVSKRYRYSRHLALDNVSLQFYPNEIGVILGHNGTGKTTLISILAGSVRPTHGCILLNGISTSQRPDLTRRKIGYCPQHEILYNELTVAEHIHLYGTLKHHGKTSLDIDSHLQKFGFSEKRNTLTKRLSGGQRRRLSVCLAFLGSASVVLLDEPTASVDPLYKRVIWDTILSMRGDGRTILLSTHHMGEADFLADRIAILSSGRLCSLGTSMTLKAKFGDGYRLLLEQDRTDLGAEMDIPFIMSVISKYVSEAKLFSRKKNSLIILLPSHGAHDGQFVLLFQHLEAVLVDKSLPPGPLAAFTRFSVTDATLDDVFLAISDRGCPRDAVINEINDCGKANNGRLNSSSAIPRENDNHIYAEKDVLISQNRNDISSRRSPTRTVVHPSSSIVNQFVVVIQTRCYHLCRNKLLWFFEFFLPCLIFLLSVIVATVYQPAIDQPPMDLNPWLMTSHRKLSSVSFFSDEYIAQSNLSYMPLFNGDRAAPLEHRSSPADSYLQALNSSFGWTGAACLSRGYYQPKPPHFIPHCQLEHFTSRWTSNGVHHPPYKRMPTGDWLLNLTAHNIANYLQSINELPVPGELYGGVSFISVDQPSASTAVLSQLMLAIRNWLNTEALQNWALNSSSDNYITTFQLSDVFPMSLSDALQLLLPTQQQINIWYNNKGYASAPAFLNMLHNLELRLSSSSSAVPDKGLVVTNYPQPFPKHSWTFSMQDSLMIEAGFVLFFLLALSSIPGNFIVLLVGERQLGIKHLQRVSGLQPVLYWLANFVADFSVYALSTCVCVLILVGFKKVAYIGPDALVPFVCLLLLFQCAMIAFVNVTSFCFHQPSTAYVVVSAINVLISSLTTSVSLLLEVFTIQDPSLRVITETVQRVFLVFPHYCLGSAIYDLAVIHFLRQYDLMTSVLAKQFVNYASLWHLVRFRMFCLCLQTVFFALLVLFIEHHDWLLRNSLCCKWQHCKGLISWIGRLATCPSLDWIFPVALSVPANGENIHPTKRRFHSNINPPYTGEELLRINQLSKRYRGQSTYAVSRLDMSVRPGECFGLLGTNGAGKSTTFALLTGQYSVSSGSILINGHDLARQPRKAHHSVGYCPQGDALHRFLTVRETLTRYARLRCIPRAQLSSHITTWLNTFGMSAHADHPVSQLSGGTKRKLATAVAFIGNPKVLLLDEPSNGMDPASKRLFWSRIQAALLENHLVFISSHCMQECETLCSRIGLLDAGQLQCQGTPLELKNRFGVGYIVELELKPSFVQSLTRHRRQQVDDLAADAFYVLFSGKLPSADITYHNRPGAAWPSSLTPSSCRLQFQYSGHGRLSKLFSLLQSLEQDLGAVERFSVKAGTLEDAFIGFVCDTGSGRSTNPTPASLQHNGKPDYRALADGSV